MPIGSIENFKDSTDIRLEELKKITASLMDNNKYLKFYEKNINKKKNELDNQKLKLEDEEKENFDKYHVKFNLI